MINNKKSELRVLDDIELKGVAGGWIAIVIVGALFYGTLATLIGITATKHKS